MRKPLILVLAAACAGCASARSASFAAPAADGDASGGGRASGPGVGDYALVVPENVVYVPWKMVAGAVKGASDGVAAGFDEGRMPFFGAVCSPLNLAAGFVTGFFEGLALEPALVGPSDHFGRAMGAPMRHQTTVWWY